LQRAVLDGAVIQEHSILKPEKKVIYPLRFYKDELSLVEKLHILINVKMPIEDEEPEYINSGLNNEQKEAVKNAFKNKISIITGGPGVGKTTTIDEIVKQARRRNLKTYLAAPTGRAAKRMSEATGKDARTIHRMLIFKEDDDDFVYGEDKQLKCDLLIVDEVSMLDLSLASRLFSAIAADTSVVLVGDKDQLPSVGPGAVLHDMLLSESIPLVTLEEVFRQEEGSKIISNSHAINHGRFPDVSNPPKDILGDFYWIEQNDPEKIEELISKMMTQRIPDRFNINKNQIQVLSPMNKGVCGRNNLNEKLQMSLNDIHKNQFKIGDRRYIVGDRVMQVSNNYDKHVFNGDLGYIMDIRQGTKTFDVMFENEIVRYDFDEAEQLSLAYAITIHKSQGSEFPAVIIPVINQHHIMLQRNLLYTGVTRARKLIILIGNRQALQRCVDNNRQSKRFTQLGHRLKEIKKFN
jgi:exodeoxyribonuclease V alpha subunit